MVCKPRGFVRFSLPRPAAKFSIKKDVFYLFLYFFFIFCYTDFIINMAKKSFAPRPVF